MRQPDINRVKRAMEHVEAARTHLENIKFESMDSKESRRVGSLIVELGTTLTMFEVTINKLEGRI